MSRGKPNPPKPNAANQNPNPETKHWIDKATALFAFVAMIATGFAAFFTGQQWQVADHSMRVANRAYVNSTELSFVNYGFKDPDGHKRWIVSPLLVNSGQTSTHSMYIHTATTMVRNGATFDGSGTPMRWDSKIAIPAYLSPKSEDISGEIFTFSQPTLIQLRMNGPSIAGLGVIWYRDVFGDPHITEFCYVATTYELINWDEWPAGQRLRIHGNRCATHNCEDQECGTDWYERATATTQLP
jgi:hypothetical protein